MSKLNSDGFAGVDVFLLNNNKEEHLVFLADLVD